MKRFIQFSILLLLILPGVYSQSVTLSTSNGDFPVGIGTLFTVPNGVTSLNVTAIGAGNEVGAAGAMVGGIISVTPGSILSIIPGVSPGIMRSGSGGSGIADVTGGGFTVLIVAGGSGNFNNASIINTMPAGEADGDNWNVNDGSGGGAGMAGSGVNGAGIGGSGAGSPGDGNGGNGLGAGGGGGSGGGGGGGATGGAGGNLANGEGGTSFLQGATLGIAIPGATVTNVGNGSVSISYDLTAANTQIQVNSGDTYIDDSAYGLILKSPDGTCYRITVDDSGTLVQTAIDCPN